MKKYSKLLVVFLFFSPCLHASWGQSWSDAWTNFKKRFSSRSATEISNDKLLSEMQKPGISPFFTASTPSLNTQGALNTTEARFIINQLLSQQAPVSQSKEKVKKITDMRELPELGTFEHNRDVSRYYLLFSGNMTSRGNPALRISLVERIAGTKRMINRQTNEIEEVPTIKKSSKITLIATGASNNKFSWQKITNEDSAEQPEHDDERTLQFKDEGKLIEGPFRPWFQSKNRIINTYKYRKPLKSALKKTPAFQGVND